MSHQLSEDTLFDSIGHNQFQLTAVRCDQSSIGLKVYAHYRPKLGAFFFLLESDFHIFSGVLVTVLLEEKAYGMKNLRGTEKERRNRDMATIWLVCNYLYCEQKVKTDFMRIFYLSFNGNIGHVWTKLTYIYDSLSKKYARLFLYQLLIVFPLNNLT